jgi:hypothetical protein
MDNNQQLIYAGTLIDGARMYAASADAINEKYPNALHVLSHTLGMSTELSLKAYLVLNGYTENQLRELGHDLGSLYKKAKEYGLLHTGSRNFRLNVLSANYQKRVFAYPKEGNLLTINPRNLREVAHEIIIEVFRSIKGKKALSELADQPGLTILSEYPESTNASAWAVK